MKKVIITIIICIITFGIIILNINSKENKKEKENNESISIILETEEGNIESDTFPSKEDYEYSSLVCENTSDEVNATFNEETWKLNLSVEEEEIDGVFNCQIHFKENTPPNPPVLDGDMVPVYYDEEDAVWKKADETNVSSEHKWYDYNNKMWANSITYDHTKVLNEGNTYEGKKFNGSEYVNVGNANYNFGKTITVAARFKITKTGASQHIISNAETAGFYLRITTPNTIEFSVYDSSSSSYKSVGSTTIINTNTWYTVVGTYDGKTIKLYVNGKLEGSLSVNVTTKTSTQPLYIGGNPNASGITNETFTGTISDAIVMKDVLSESEIKENYGNEINYQSDSNLVFNKKFGNQETYLTESSYTEEGVNFNGSTSHINAGYSDYDLGSKVTAIARFKTSVGETSEHIISNAGSAGLYLSVYENKVDFQIYCNTGKAYKGVFSTTIEKNKWYTAVGTYDGKTIKLYVNGKLEGSLSVTDTIKVSAQPMFVGANPETDGNHLEYFNGTISDAIVINDVLSESEIKENYSEEVNYKENDKTLFAYDLQGYEGRNNGEVIPMEAISTMQVWIPRYKYKVWNYNSDGTKTSEPKEIDIRFERGTESTGEITCTDNIQGENGDGTSEVCELNNETCTDNLCNGSYYTHPAFTFGSEQLTGFWVGKFEVSSDIECSASRYSVFGEGCNLTTIKPLIKPNEESWRGAEIATYDEVLRAMNDSGNIYGLPATIDTHMIKNSDWGSIVYLSHSRYGSGKDIEINGTTLNSYMTGCGPQSLGTEQLGSNCNAYNTSIGMSASTTGNIHGVYDISGGAWEITMANMVSPNGTTMLSGHTTRYNSGYSGIVYDSGNYTSYTGRREYPESKYYDKYSFYDDERTIALASKNSKLGDATKEVRYINSSNWYNDLSHSITAEAREWFVRGGYWNDTNPINIGMFSIGAMSGVALDNTGARLVISIY